MHWFAIICFGLLTGLAGAVYGGFMADLAVDWLAISSFEGGAGYFVVFMILLAFGGSLIAGIVICALAGGPGWSGMLRGFASALAAVLLVITALGAFAWATADREPLVAGQPIDVAVEVRLPAGSSRPEGTASGKDYAALLSGSGSKSRLDYLRPGEAREEGGRWILPAQIPIHVSEGRRVLSVKLADRDTQFFDTPIPARPAAIDEAWSDWLAAPYLGNLSPPAPEAAIAIRYRVVVRPPPPPREPPAPRAPTEAERLQAVYDTLSAEAPTEEWLALTTLEAPEPVRDGALKTVAHRPDFAAALAARIASSDAVVARDAMYLVGTMHPPPAALGDAVRARAAEVMRIAEAIDPAAEDSRDRLYEEAFELSSGVKAASFGLRRAGVDFRPELRAMAAATRPREKAPPHAIADDLDRIVAYFDKLEREAAGK
ncbi:hypothetical protein [Desertibaculum subflavum]|uniref:hypothetical protein n=1 Tax=Desertibaculum subflavum TaxID=2268458 RepID=UPI000E66E3B4